MSSSVDILKNSLLSSDNELIFNSKILYNIRSKKDVAGAPDNISYCKHNVVP